MSDDKATQIDRIAAGSAAAQKLTQIIEQDPSLAEMMRNASRDGGRTVLVASADAEPPAPPPDKDEPIQAVMDALGEISSRLDDFSSRIDDIESRSASPPPIMGDDDDDAGRVRRRRRKDDDDDDEDVSRAPHMEGDPDDKELGEPVRVAADSGFSPKTEVLFADAQVRADKVFSAFGGSAPPPLAGEKLSSYRRRLLRPLMTHSDKFKDVDMRAISADPKLFDKIEAVVHADAVAASRSNSLVPDGYLTERKQNRNGHIHTEFFGRPSSWMSRFAPAGRAVKKINLRPPTAPDTW